MNDPITRRGVIAALMLFAVLAGLRAAGEESGDLLAQALKLVQQVESPASAAQSSEQRVAGLMQAIQLTQQAPNHRLKGHRVLAIQAMRGAIAALQKGDPNGESATFLHTADTELSASVALANADDTGAPPSVPAAASRTMTNAAATTNEPDWWAHATSNVTQAEADIYNAARGGDAQKVKALLAGDPALVRSHVDFRGTPLHGAAAGGHADVAKILLAANADPNAKKELGETALHFAVEGGFTDVADLLIAQHADVNAQDNMGQTPLYKAFFAVPWRREIAAALLAHGANPNLADISGKTPLHEAAMWIRPDEAEFLLAAKADPNVREKNGDTPLYTAISCGARDDIAQVLLAHGADPSIAGHDGQTPRDIALKQGDTDMAKILGDPSATLGAPPAPADGLSPEKIVSRFVGDLGQTPPGPVENDVTQETLDTLQQMAKMAGDATSTRDSLVRAYHLFTLHGPVTEFYAQGRAAIYAGRATLNPAAQDEFKEEPPNESSTEEVTQNGKPVDVESGPTVMFAPGVADYVDKAPVPVDGEVTVSFCLVQEQGHWKVHCLYFSIGSLSGDAQSFVVKQLAAFSRK